MFVNTYVTIRVSKWSIFAPIYSLYLDDPCSKRMKKKRTTPTTIIYTKRLNVDLWFVEWSWSKGAHYKCVTIKQIAIWTEKKNKKKRKKIYIWRWKKEPWRNVTMIETRPTHKIENKKQMEIKQENEQSNKRF